MMWCRWSVFLSAAACLWATVAIAATNKDTATAAANEKTTTASRASVDVTKDRGKQRQPTRPAVTRGSTADERDEPTADERNAPTADECNGTAADDDKPRSDELRERLERLTGDLSKAVASVEIAKQRQKQLSVLERQKYG